MLNKPYATALQFKIVLKAKLLKLIKQAKSPTKVSFLQLKVIDYSLYKSKICKA